MSATEHLIDQASTYIAPNWLASIGLAPIVG